ncbi:glycoside hydrolase family 28 protein [Hyaloscypha variabilis]
MEFAQLISKFFPFSDQPTTRTSLVTSFCATYTAQDITATSAVPSAINSACSGLSKTISEACTCFVTPATTTAKTTTATTLATSTTKATTTATAASGVGGTIISTLAGGSGVGGTTCTVTAFADITASMKACSNILISDITVPASTTLSVTVPTSGALLFGGTMTIEYTPDASYTPIVLKGTDAKVVGLEGAVINGLGADYWDGQGSNGGTAKPDHLIKIDDMVSSSFSNIKIINWPTHLFEVTGCTDVTISQLILDNSAGNALDSSGVALGHNTDAFDVSNTDGLYVVGVTVYNQDDCVAVNSGSNMVFENMYCDGGHGLSIGSISSGVTVNNITFKDSSVVNSENGCRIKTDAGDDDSTVSLVTYSNIYVDNISDYAIDVQQDYENGDPTGDPTSGIIVSDITFSDITGSVASGAYEYYILCGSTASCYDFTWTNIDITGGLTECSPSGAECP